MTKAQRAPAVARQWDVINNILKSSSQIPHLSQYTQRPYEAKISHIHERTNNTDQRRLRPSQDIQHEDQAHSSQHLTRGSQSTVYQQEDQHRSRFPRQSSTAYSDLHLDRSYYRAEDCHNDQGRSRSPQEEQQRNQSHVQSHPKKPAGRLKESETTLSATKEVDHSVQPGSGKRKRTTIDDGNDTERIQATKKGQISYPNVERSKQSLPRTRVDQKSVALKSAAATTIHIVKDQCLSERKPPTQLATPPSSKKTERESHGERHLKMNHIPTPTSDGKFPKDRDSPLLVGIQSMKSRKRQRDEDVDTREEPERFRHLKVRSPTRPQQSSPAELLPALKQSHPPLHVHFCAVRTKPPFAAVTPDQRREQKFVDTPHESVPILYASKVSHSSDADLINNPSGTLVVNALAIIGPSIDQQAERGWPSTIELPDRAPSQSHPIKVLTDIDLYLHKKENKLCVATDRGLITVTSYLKLIGVPKKQPVRVEGRVPSWARVAFRTPERRRIMVPPNDADPRRFETVPSKTALGTHQIALTLGSHVKVAEERQNLECLQNQAGAEARAEAECRLTVKSFIHGKEIERNDNNGFPEPQLKEMLILSAGPGCLPLRAGSIVLVYAVDDEDNWAYGRLSGTDKMGRFPIQHTCPIDWSLDRFAGTNDDLTPVLPDSKDPSERDWRGLHHWLRQEGYTFGPTWKETLEAGAAKARYEKARNMAISKLRTKINSSFAAAESNTHVERSASQKLPSDKQAPSPIPNAQVATEPFAATVISTTIEGEVREATPVMLSPNVNEDAENTQLERDQTEVPAESAQSAEGMFESEMKATSLLEPVQVEDLNKESDASESELPKAIGASFGHHEPKSLDYNDKGVDVSPKQECGEASSGSASSPRTEAPDARSAGVNHDSGGETAEVRATAGNADISACWNPFTKPRHDMFARDDDIEYDWGDPEEEL